MYSGGPPPGFLGTYPPPPQPAYPPAYHNQQQQQQQPIRLARYPGDELHSGPPPGSMPPPAQQTQYPPSPARYQQHQQQHYQGGAMMAPPPPPPGGVPAGVYMVRPPPLPPPPGGMPYFIPQQFAGHPGMGMPPPPPPGMMQHQQQQQQQQQQKQQQQQHQHQSGGMYAPPPPPASYMQRPAGSGGATPGAHSAAGSGASTPAHPMQRRLSSGNQQMLLLQPHPPPQQSTFQPPLMSPAPPGVYLPDSLSPAAQPGLRGGGPPPPQAAFGGPGGGSLPGSRAQSAGRVPSQMAPIGYGPTASPYGPPPAAYGAYGPAPLMEPLSPPRGSGGGGGLKRTGSAGSLGGSGSLRTSLEQQQLSGGASGGGSLVRRSSERAYSGGSSSGGGYAALQQSKPGSLAGSRVGSAGRSRSGIPIGATSASSPQVEQLDEYDNIKVAVRVRPPNAQELARGDAQALFVNPADHRQVQLVVPPSYSRSGTSAARSFAFHACLGPASRQADVLRLCGITQLLDAALDGYNATIMAYGQTGSGKTFTMSGLEDPQLEGGDGDGGIIARACAYLFDAAGGGGGLSRRDNGCRYSLRASFSEIYNEQIYDLVRFDRKQQQVRWEATKGFHLPDLLCKECGSLEEMMELLALALRHRRVGSHELNMESSRSHSIFTVYVDCTPTRPDDHEYGMTRYGKVSFVDLAGSERLRDSRSAGETLRETTNINRSLFMLGKVIAALADGAQGARVPYRESKLTKLLMDSLGGSSLSLLIACCSPSAAHIEETLSTLSYASRAKNIRNQPAVQVDPEQAALSELKREVRLLRSENAYLQEQLFQASLPGGQQLPPPPSQPASRLPSSHGHPSPGGDGALALPPPAFAGQAVAAGEVQGAGGDAAASAPGSRPLASAGGAAATAAASGSSPCSPEEMMRRLLETQRMLVQFSRENDRLASENGRLRSGRALVANDYKGALEEVEWLRTKLESLESALTGGSLGEGGLLPSGLLAALDGAAAASAAGAGSRFAGVGDGGATAAEVLEAAREAVLSGGDGNGGGGAGLLASLEPLASQLAAAAASASVAANQAVAEAAAAAAALAAPQPATVAQAPSSGEARKPPPPEQGGQRAAQQPVEEEQGEPLAGASKNSEAEGVCDGSVADQVDAGSSTVVAVQAEADVHVVVVRRPSSSAGGKTAAAAAAVLPPPGSAALVE